MKIHTLKHNGLTFAHVKSPGSSEVKYLEENFQFSLLNLEDYMHKTQVPKIEVYKNYSLIVMDFPYVEQVKPKSQISIGTMGDNRIPFIPNILTNHMPFPRFVKIPREKRISIGEVDFFIGKDYLVILHDEKTPQIDDIFALCGQNEAHRQELMGKGPVYLYYRIADVLVDAAFTVVNDMTTTIDDIDRRLSERLTGEVIADISVTRRNIVVFQTMIKPALPLYADLEKGKYQELNGTMAPYWSNILDHLQKIWDRLEDNKEFIEGISRSYESFLTIRTNETIKVLTLFTAILLPLTFIASIYGMNIHLPLTDDPHAFTYLVVLMTALAGFMVGIFKLREWL